MFAKAAKLFHQTIVETHELSIVIILKDKLPRTHFRFLVEKHFGAEVALEFIQSGSDVRVRVELCRRMSAARPPRGQFFNLPDS